MNIMKSKELAFFNMLGKLIEVKSMNKNQDITISFEELQDKMEIDKALISSFLNKLKEDKILEILNENTTSISLNFEKTHEKLLEFVHPDDLDVILLEINEFIFKYSNQFKFDETYVIIKAVAKKIYNMEQAGDTSDFSHLIRKGIKALYDNPYVVIYFSKFFYKLAENIEAEDQYVLENIIYYFYTLPYDENPFIATIFLTQVAFQLEALKKGIVWENLFQIDEALKELER
ncbi:MAG: hypothetical protein ACRCUA_01350 [Fusobacteriaceae bacterium]